MSFIEEILERIQLGQFSDDIKTSAPSYLLHLTRIIDRTEDLYNLSPVWPIMGGEGATGSKVTILAASTKRRIQRQLTVSEQERETSRLWRNAARASKISPQKDAADRVLYELSAGDIELAWRQPNLSSYSLLEPGFGYDETRWKNEVETIFEAALQKKFELRKKSKRKQSREPLIFFLPEFCFPPFQDQVKRSRFLKSLRETYSKYHAEDIHSAQDFLFLGTYHDLSRNFNLGVCFPFGLSPFQSHVGPSFQHQSNEGVYFQRKRHASRKLGEFLAPVDTMNFPIFQTTAGRVAVLICSDIYDPSLFLSLVRYNLRCMAGAEIKFVLVPAYNKSRKLVESCRQLSYLMNNVVVYNTSFPDRDASQHSGNSHCFMCGRKYEELETLPERNNPLAGVIERSESDIRDPAGQRSASKLIEYSIDLDKLDLLRLATRKRYPRSIIQGSRRVTSVE